MRHTGRVNCTETPCDDPKNMIRFHLAKLIADKSFAEKRRIELGEVATETGIHRSTLSRIINVPGCNVTAANMDRLCKYFGCSLGDLAEYVPD